MKLSINNIANGAANLIWAICGGLVLAIFYWFYAFVCCVTIIGIPFGVQLFKLGYLMIHPFGYCIDGEGGLASGCMNIIWIIWGGLALALAHVCFGLLFCITIVGIPFGLMHFRFAWFALVPFGKTIEKDD
ncbi:MAG: YccF domain-containing protein [bacterium]